MNFWNAFTGISTAATGVIILVSVLILRRAVYAQAFDIFWSIFQEKCGPELRGKLFALQDSGKCYDQWKEEKDAIAVAEQVGRTLDAIAQMVYHGMLPKALILKHTRTSVARCWTIIKDHVLERREKAPELWQAFQDLAEEAMARNRLELIMMKLKRILRVRLWTLQPKADEKPRAESISDL